MKSKDEHSEEEDVSEKPSVRSNRNITSNETTRRKKDHTFGIDHQIKYNKNKRLKHWLNEKDKIYWQDIKEEKVTKREEREKLINDKIEKTIESQKRERRQKRQRERKWK